MLESNLLDTIAQFDIWLAAVVILTNSTPIIKPMPRYIANRWVAFCDLAHGIDHVGALAGCVLQAAFRQHVQGGAGSGASNWIAAIGGAVCAGGQGHHTLFAKETTQRNAAGDPLGSADDNWLDAPMFNCPPLAGAAMPLCTSSTISKMPC